MLIDERGGDPMMTHIAMMKALHRDTPKAETAPRRKAANVLMLCKIFCRA
jgi:hypothetical protein